MVRRPRQAIQATTTTEKVSWTGPWKQGAKGASKTTSGVVTLSMSGPPGAWAIPVAGASYPLPGPRPALSSPLLHMSGSPAKHKPEGPDELERWALFHREAARLPAGEREVI